MGLIKTKRMLITPENRLILASIKINAKEEDLEQINVLIPQVVDWAVFTQKIIDRGLAPLFYIKIPLLTNNILIPPESTTKLQQAYYRTLTRSVMLHDAFGKIAQALSVAKIRFIPLKGIYLMEALYDDIGLRQLSDIDILVHHEDGERCLEALAVMGYKTGDTFENDFVNSKSEIVHFEPVVLNGIAIEVHTKLHRAIETYDMSIDEVWKNSEVIDINSKSYSIMCFNDLLIHVILHLDRHFRQGRVQFTGYIDITNLLDKYAEQINWDDFISRCKLFKCEQVVFVHIVMVYKYMHVFVPSSIIKKYDVILKPTDEQLFISYLNGHVGFISGMPNHLSSLMLIDSYWDKLMYCLKLIFPSKRFMISKYLQNKETRQKTKDEGQKTWDKGKLSIINYQLSIKFWWLWYPYRWGVGVKGLIQLIKRTVLPSHVRLSSRRSLKGE